MNSNNNGVSPEAMIFIGVLALALFIIKVVVILALSVGILLAIYTSVIMLFALNRPIEIDGETITPELARTFFGGGIAGAIGCFAITAVSSDLGLDHPKEIVRRQRQWHRFEVVI